MKSMHRILFLLTFLSAPAFAIDYDRFHTPTEIDGFLRDFVRDHGAIAQLQSIGTTHQGREILALKISDNVAVNEPSEGDVVFSATQHAREWLAAETAIYLAEQILTQYGTNPQITSDVNNSQIWILPVTNPDGYVFTHAAPMQRCHRNNLRGPSNGTGGVNLNRNWSVAFGGAASSDVPGSLNYKGPFAFSEPETRAMRDFLDGLTNFKALFNYHTYSELYLRPWSYTPTDPPGEETLKVVSDRSIDVVERVLMHRYGDSLGQVSGEITDWIWSEHRSVAFTPELRPDTALCNDFPTNSDCICRGFRPPESVILPNNQENVPAALALIHDAASREVWIRDYPGDTGAEPSATWLGDRWSQAFWVSPDITTVPETLDQGATVDLNVRVNNNTGSTRRNVRVDTYFTDPRISLEFPNSDAQLIGSETVDVPPGGLTVTIPWTVPVGTNSWGERHWCVGAILMHETDMPLTTEAQRSSNVAIRNFNTTDTVVSMNFIVAASNFLNMDSELLVFVDEDALPDGWRVIVPPPGKVSANSRLGRKAKLLGATGRLLSPTDTVYIPVRVEPPPNTPIGTEVDVHIHAGLRPLVAGKRPTMGNGFTYRVRVIPPGPI